MPPGRANEVENMRRLGEGLTVLAIVCAVLFTPFAASAQEGTPAATAAGYEEGLVHTVVQGDTLWDLSAKYLGSPWQWTELWERNRFLTNPHYIYPGIRIEVFPPPSREYSWEFRESVPEAGPATGSAAAEAPASSEQASTGPEESARTALSISPEQFVRAGEFTPERPEGIGSIRGGEQARNAFSEGDKVFLSLDKEIPPGQILGVYRVRGPVRSRAERPVSGYVRYLVGILQVTEKRDDGAGAIVRKSFEDLGRADLISEEIPSYSAVYPRDGGSGIDSFVISGQTEKVELATGDYVYLDRGADAGVAAGDVFRLYNGWSRGAWGGMGRSAKDRIMVGKAVVLRVLPGSATAFVTSATQSFQAGAAALRGHEEAP